MKITSIAVPNTLEAVALIQAAVHGLCTPKERATQVVLGEPEATKRMTEEAEDFFNNLVTKRFLETMVEEEEEHEQRKAMIAWLKLMVSKLEKGVQ